MQPQCACCVCENGCVRVCVCVYVCLFLRVFERVCMAPCSSTRRLGGPQPCGVRCQPGGRQGGCVHL